MQKILIIVSLIMIAMGLIYPYLKSLPIGKLPGDLTFKGDLFSLYFPIATCAIVSIVISLLFKLFR